MKYLNKFANYLNESNSDITDLSKEELDDLLLPITDLGITYTFGEPMVITEGEFSGQKSMNVVFRNNFKIGPGSAGLPGFFGYTDQIIDEKFWDFLDELIAFKNRLESSRVSISTNWRHSIVVTFVQKSKVEGPLFIVTQLYNEMRKRTNAAKSDFVNSMTKKLDKDNLKITVNCHGFREGAYTDRKWNNLFRGIDFSKFNLEKEISEDRNGDKSAVITITLKPEFNN